MFHAYLLVCQQPSTVTSSPAQRLTEKPSSSFVKLKPFNDPLFLYSLSILHTWCVVCTAHTEKVNEKMKNIIQTKVCRILSPAHSYVYGSRCHNLLLIKSANLCLFFFAIRCTQPQLIFSFLVVFCAIVAQHIVWRSHMAWLTH